MLAHAHAPMPIGEIGGSKATRACGREGDHPGCTSPDVLGPCRGAEAWGNPATRRSFTLARREGQRPLEIHKKESAHGAAVYTVRLMSSCNFLKRTLRGRVRARKRSLPDGRDDRRGASRCSNGEGGRIERGTARQDSPWGQELTLSDFLYIISDIGGRHERWPA